MKIESFRDEYDFLSNFFASPLVHDGISYPTVEHAFQAAKTLDFRDRILISKCTTAGKAKRRGRGVELRPDWEHVKVEIMKELLIQKFARHHDLKFRLLLTDGIELIEGNFWGDTFWGVCDGRGKNILGQLLELVRELLK